MLARIALILALCVIGAAAAPTDEQQQQWPTAKFGLNAAELPRSVQLSKDIWLHWGVAGEVITLGVTASLPANTAYLGVGLSELGSMKGADIWLLNNTSSGWSLVDSYAPGFVRPVADRHQDLKLLGVEASNSGLLVAAWRGFLAPCDLQDLPIVAGVPNHVIWAHHGSWGYHGPSSRGSKLVTFISTTNTTKEAAAAEPADADVKTLDLVFNTTIPTNETTYFIHSFKLPNDKKYHIVKYEPITHLPNDAGPQLHHGVAYTCPPEANAKVAALPSLGPFDRFQTNMLCEVFYMLLTPNFTYPVPAVAGIPMGTPSTTWVAVELHYNNPEGLAGIKDPGSGIRIHYTDKLRPQDMGMITLNQLVLSIPPGVQNYPTNVSVCPGSCTARFKQPVTLLDTLLHEHGTGKSITVRRYRNNKELSPIAQLRAFDYAFQGHTPIAPEARTLLPGDALTLQCVYDSTGRTKVTNGGPGTSDEMCFAWLQYYPAQEDMGLCYSFGDQPLALCGGDFSLQTKLYAAVSAANASAQLQQMVAAHELLPAENPAVNATPYKAPCTTREPAAEVQFG